MPGTSSHAPYMSPKATSMVSVHAPMRSTIINGTASPRKRWRVRDVIPRARAMPRITFQMKVCRRLLMGLSACGWSTVMKTSRKVMPMRSIPTMVTRTLSAAPCILLFSFRDSALIRLKYGGHAHHGSVRIHLPLRAESQFRKVLPAIMWNANAAPRARSLVALSPLLLISLLAMLLLAACGGAPDTPTPVPSPTPEPTQVPPTEMPSPSPVPPTPTLESTATPSPIPQAERGFVPILCYHHIREWEKSDGEEDRAYIVPP